MGCHCGEIDRCRRDIATLSQMIHLFQELSEDDGTVLRQLNVLTEDTQSTVSPGNIGELTNGEVQLHTPVQRCRGEMLQSCEAEYRRLERELSALEEADQQYHHMELAE